MLRFVYVLFVCSVLVGSFGRVASVHASGWFQQKQPSAPVSERIIELVNAERVKAGLPVAHVSDALMTEAQRFSVVQAALQGLSHRSSDQTNAGERLKQAGYRWKFYGEALAAGQPTPEAVVAGWMNSPTHRAILLHPKAQEIGVGHTHNPDDTAGFVDYYVMEVALPR